MLTIIEEYKYSILGMGKTPVDYRFKTTKPAPKE